MSYIGGSALQVLSKLYYDVVGNSYQVLHRRSSNCPNLKITHLREEDSITRPYASSTLNRIFIAVFRYETIYPHTPQDLQTHDDVSDMINEKCFETPVDELFEEAVSCFTLLAK